MSINLVKCSWADNIITNGNPTLLYQPEKFIDGIDTTKLGLGSLKILLNGTSSQNSPISV